MKYGTVNLTIQVMATAKNGLWKNLYSRFYAVLFGELFLPIDPDFQTKRQVATEHNEHKVWGPVNPPETLGIHGTYVAVDWDVCIGDGTCADVCPVSLYDMVDTPGNSLSQRKADPARELECIQCLACQIQCPVAAIKITPST
jgi:NAD-dependent dihydropyrimidine dehydrogenase PreA subunit